jgi:hypothetical protein
MGPRRMTGLGEALTGYSITENHKLINIELYPFTNATIISLTQELVLQSQATKCHSTN